MIVGMENLIQDLGFILRVMRRSGCGHREHGSVRVFDLPLGLSIPRARFGQANHGAGA